MGDEPEPAVPASATEVDQLLDRFKSLLDGLGYPTGRTWKERHNKFCFRIMKHLCAFARVLHRAQVTPAELESVCKLAELLGGEDPRVSAQRGDRGLSSSGM